MSIKFAHNVVFVKDINVSRKFYGELLGIPILQDFTIFILFENDFAIHQSKELIQTIYKTDKPGSDDKQGRNNMDIYFESDTMEMMYTRLLENNVEIIHPIEKQSWGQRVFRFYDPDHHIVEIGEPSFINFCNN